LKGALEDWTKSLELVPLHNKAVRDHLEEHLVEAKEYGHRWGDVIQGKKKFEEAYKLSLEKNYEPAIALYRLVLDSIPKTQFGRLSAYNIACACALSGKTVQALDWLEKSVDLGYREFEHMKKDSDLDSLREEERYLKLVGQLGAR